MKPLIIVSLLAAILTPAMPISAIMILPPEPQVPHGQDGPLYSQSELRNGLLVTKIINPSYPETLTNKYIYIPTELSGNSPNIQMYLGNTFHTTGEKPEIYAEYIPDAISRRLKNVITWGKVVNIAVAIGTANIALAFVHEPGNPEGIIDINNKINEQGRSNIMKTFLTDFLYGVGVPDFNLPKPLEDHFILPPSSALLIKTPVTVTKGNPSVLTRVLEYNALDTQKTNAKDESFAMLAIMGILKNSLNHNNIEYHTYSMSIEEQVDVSPVLVDSNQLTQTTDYVAQFLLDLWKSISIILKISGSDADIIIIDPDGNVYKGVEATQTLDAVTINNPKPGNWTVIIKPVDIPQEGEPFELSVVGLQDLAFIPEINITKTFKGKIKETYYSKTINGWITITINNTGKVPIQSISLNDTMPQGNRFNVPSSLKAYLSTGTHDITLQQRSIYSATVSNSTLKFNADFTKGTFPKGTYKQFSDEYRNLYRAECLTPLLPSRQIRECIKAKYDDAMVNNTLYFLEPGMQLTVTYPVFAYINKNQTSLGTELSVDANSIEDDLVRRLLRFDLLS